MNTVPAREGENLQLSQPEWRVLSRLFDTFPELPDVDHRYWWRARFRRGDFMFKRGESCYRFVLIGEGRIRLQMIGAPGRVLTLYRVHPGQLCLHSMMNLINHNEFAIEAVAETDGWLAWVDKDRFQAWLDSSPSFRTWIFANMAERMNDLMQRIELLAFQPIELRLIDYLLEAAGGDGQVLVTQRQLAQELGTAREVINRQLGRLEAEKLIERNRGCIRLIEIESLLAKVA